MAYSDVAGAAFTRQQNQVCVVLTADCLPILLCDKSGSVIAIAHVGWRGLVDGIIKIIVAKMQNDATQLMTWFGPAIGPKAFFVGEDVCQIFVKYN